MPGQAHSQGFHHLQDSSTWGFQSFAALREILCPGGCSGGCLDNLLVAEPSYCACKGKKAQSTPAWQSLEPLAETVLSAYTFTSNWLEIF